jgi:hypothetical protein
LFACLFLPFVLQKYGGLSDTQPDIEAAGWPPRQARRNGRESAMGLCSMGSVDERRHRERIDLQCPVDIFVTPEAPPLKATTRDLTSDGVYWISSAVFAPGDRVQCSIYITPPGYRAAKTPVCLHCCVQVMRVERRTSGFGAGCRIESFMLSPGRGLSGTALDHSPEETLTAVSARCP